jgi:hypothetical protein
MGEMDGTLVSEDKVVHNARKPPFMPCMVLAQGAFDILNWMFDQDIGFIQLDWRGNSKKCAR